MSRLPTGTSAPSTSRIRSSRRWASSTPRLGMPSRTRSAGPLLCSRISCAMRRRARDTSLAERTVRPSGSRGCPGGTVVSARVKTRTSFPASRDRSLKDVGVRGPLYGVATGSSDGARGADGRKPAAALRHPAYCVPGRRCQARGYRGGCASLLRCRAPSGSRDRHNVGLCIPKHDVMECCVGPQHRRPPAAKEAPVQTTVPPVQSPRRDLCRCRCRPVRPSAGVRSRSSRRRTPTPRPAAAGWRPRRGPRSSSPPPAPDARLVAAVRAVTGPRWRGSLATGAPVHYSGCGLPQKAPRSYVSP